MNETQKKRYQHLTNPGVIISLLVTVFGIGVTWGTLNYRVNKLEDFQKEINMVEIQKDIAEIKTNVAWLTKLVSDMTR